MLLPQLTASVTFGVTLTSLSLFLYLVKIRVRDVGQNSLRALDDKCKV